MSALAEGHIGEGTRAASRETSTNETEFDFEGAIST
jgi:hypothetical protein